MACYHFDTQIGDAIIRDEKVTNCQILMPRVAKLGAAREILIEAIRTLKDVPDRFLITDCNRTVHAIVAFHDALPPSMRR